METDNELVRQIRETLNNYQEEYIPGSWERFTGKQKKQKRLVIIRWGIGFAASLIVGLIATYSVFNQNKISHQHQNQMTIKNNVHVNENKPNTVIVNKAESYKTIPENQTNLLVKNQGKETQNDDSDEMLIGQNELNNADRNDGNQINNLLIANKLNNVQEKVEIIPDSSDLNVLYANEANSAIKDSNKAPVILSQAQIDSALMAYQKPLPAIIEEENSDGKRRVWFGVNLSPGINSTQSAVAMNYGGGVNTDITLFGDVSLSTGMQLEKQNIVDNGSNSDMPAGGVEADFLTIDVPINITWKFSSNKRRSFYVSSGVSSMAYIDQKYENTNYQYMLVETTNDDWSNSYQLAENKETRQTEKEPFETFNFAGRINILFGVEQQLSAKFNLHVEPFVKIPVTGLGSENLKFTTSGITCKVTF
jgi:hypothetical protein